jgi:SanA protein
MRRRTKGIVVLICTLIMGSPLSMLGWLHTTAAARITGEVDALPVLAEACVMGARVYGPGRPSPVAQQRVDAAARLASAQPGLHFVVSGHEAAEHEASELAEALVVLGVDALRIRVDPDGSSTLANVEALTGRGDGPVVFISQGYHLPRTLWMARRHGLDAWGLAAEQVAPTDAGAGWLETRLIRGRRHLREGVLALSHLVGVYGRMSES